MSISGEVKVSGNGNSFGKKVGVFEADVVRFNPDAEWYAENGMELKEGSRATEYLGVDKEGNNTLRISCWTREVESKQLFNLTFFLKDKEVVKLDGTKKQYINDQGTTTWATDEESLPSWFAAHQHRVAKDGEEELYNFLKTWLDDLDFKKDAKLNLDWKKLMNGDLREISDQVGGKFCKTVILGAIIKTVDTDHGVTKEYQGVFNKAVTHGYNMKYFRTKDFSEDYLNKLRKMTFKERKGYERFAVTLTDPQYGCKDFYSLKLLHDYNSKENPVSVKTTTNVGMTDDTY